MSEQAGDSSDVLLVLTEESTAVMLAPDHRNTSVGTTDGSTKHTISREIPKASLKRSALITDLREDLSDQVTLPLPLSIRDVEAWLRCSASPCCGGPDAAPHEDDTLLRALRAADFLRDDATAAEVTDGLAAAVCEAMAQQHDTGKEACQAADGEAKAAAESPEARACKILRAVPRASVVAILTLAHSKHAAVTEARAPAAPQRRGRVPVEECLLRLLPRSFHPDVMKACSMGASDPRCSNMWAMYG